MLSHVQNRYIPEPLPTSQALQIRGVGTNSDPGEAPSASAASGWAPPRSEEPRPNLAERANLARYMSRHPATDFDTWEQAEAALDAGVRPKELVFREFCRTFGPENIECAPPLI